MANKVRQYVRTCEWCGKPFGTLHRHKRYCSNDCQKLAADYQRILKTVYPRKDNQHGEV